MILPTKGLSTDRALLSVGAEILRRLETPKTVSRLWDQMRQPDKSLASGLSFDWFVLSLSLLHMVGAINLDDGLISRYQDYPK